MPGRLLTLRTRGSAAYKGIYALLLKEGALDWRTGEAADMTLYFDEAIDIHHIFPKAWCAKQYLARLASSAAVDTDTIRKHVATHIADADLMAQDDFGTFFATRARALLDQIATPRRAARPRRPRYRGGRARRAPPGGRARAYPASGRRDLGAAPECRPGGCLALGRGAGSPHGMSSHLVLLDNEAVQALANPGHPKHPHVVSHVQVVASRKRRAMPITVAVPTAIRVEAGWNRNSPAWAFLNRLRIADMPLDAPYASAAASIRHAAQVSVADAHIGAVVQSASADRISVITSDPADMRRVAGDRNVTVVTI